VAERLWPPVTGLAGERPKGRRLGEGFR
jgi:hypothetical protein